MKRTATVYLSLFWIFIVIVTAISATGCANIIPPSGGPRDSLPPVLIASFPPDSATNYSGNRITLTFDEYINLDNPLENVLISPVPKNNPIIEYKLKNINVRLRDTLEENTTYTIDFGNAIKDVNEGNIFKNFTYIFSTGSRLDDNTLSGQVLLAETGKADSTLIAVLHKNLDDSAVAKEKPRYIARIDGKGNFEFKNLPSGTFALYAIPTGFSKRYDDSTRPFAFAGQAINLDSNLRDVTLYAFEKPKTVIVKPNAATVAAAAKDKLLKFSASVQGGAIDILEPIKLQFNRPITKFDSSKIQLTNADFQPIANYTISTDTSLTTFTLSHPWPANTPFNLVIQKDAFADSTGITLAKNDTIRMMTKKEDEYGSLKIRFNNLDTSRHPVLQLVSNEVIAIVSPITQRDWTRKLVKPGNYLVRILYDTNQNGKWDTGEFFGERRQPEIVRDLEVSIDVRPNWDNEQEINL